VVMGRSSPESRKFDPGWAKGLTAATDERVRRMALSKTGKPNWARGLSAATDPRIAKQAATRRGKQRGPYKPRADAGPTFRSRRLRGSAPCGLCISSRALPGRRGDRFEDQSSGDLVGRTVPSRRPILSGRYAAAAPSGPCRGTQERRRLSCRFFVRVGMAALISATRRGP